MADVVEGAMIDAAGQMLAANERLVLAMVQAHADAEEAARLLSEVTRAAHFDPLTGLPNRVLFLDRFEQALTHARRLETRIALLFIDIDRFKEINDELGHAAGDKVLVNVARVLVATVREADTVSRHGGDEFLVLLTGITSAGDAIAIAQKLLDAIAVPIDVGGDIASVVASVGISLFPDDGAEVATLIERADFAMYRAKEHRIGIAVCDDRDDDQRNGVESVRGGAGAMTSTPRGFVTEGSSNRLLRDTNEHLMIALLNAQAVQVATERAQPYRALIDHMEDGAVTIDEAGIVLFSSQRFATMVGLHCDAVVGTPFVRYFVNAAEGEMFARLIARSPENRTREEFVVLAAHGERIPVHLALVDVQLHGSDAFTRVTCIIVTDLRASRLRGDEFAALNARLRSAVSQRSRTEDRLELALDAAGMGSWELDVASRSIWCSRRNERIFGRDRMPPDATLKVMLEQVLPEDRPAVDAAFDDATKAGVIDIEFRIRRADNGTTHWVHLQAKVFHEFDRPVRIAGVVTDVTERRVVDDQLRQAQKMEAVGQLTGGIAHDFNNLLLVIGGSIELLARRIPSDERTTRLIESARSGILRGTKLNQHLLAFARRQELDAKVLCIDDLLPVFEELAARAMDTTVEIRIERSPEPWLSRVDRNQLEIAVLNLAINGRDAMPRGGTLTMAVANCTLGMKEAAIRDVKAGDFVAMSVEDTGTGMAPDVLAHVFEPFFTTKQFGKGTGLGLSQIYGFVRQSGGFVAIESAPERGTKVSIHLPRTLAPDASVPADTRQAPSSITKRSGLVMVVDDDADVRQTAGGMLRDIGYAVIDAPDASVAIALLDEGLTFDLVFSDIVMPGGMSGIALAAELIARRPGQAILLTSGYSARVTTDEIIPEGVTMLQKPYDQQTLDQTVAATIAAFASRTTPH